MFQQRAELRAAGNFRANVFEVDEFNLQNALKHWDAIGTNVMPPSVRMSLKDATIASAEGSTLRLAFASVFHRDKVADTKASRSVEEVLRDVFKKPIRIQCVLEKTATASTGPTTDLVEAAAEVFGGF